MFRSIGYIKWFFVITIFLLLATVTEVHANEGDTAEKLEQNANQVASKEKDIVALEKKINELQGKRAGVANEASIITSQVSKLEQQLEKAKLEVQSTEISINEVESQKNKTEQEIDLINESIEDARQQLRTVIRLLYEREQDSIIGMFFSSWSLSTFLAERAAYNELRDRTTALITSLRENEEKLSDRKSELDIRQDDLGNLKTLLDRQHNDLADKSREQREFLNAKKEEQATYENLIAEARQARDEIKQGLFTLKNSNIKMSLTDAFGIARYAGSLTGVRPAILLSILKIETSMGSNLGSGKFPDDMHPASREAFLRITKRLSLDPYSTPISRRQQCGPSPCWGGAMGPAQFMPATWEGIEGRVENLSGRVKVNPYDLQDSMLAMALYLADRGATNPAREREALGRYIAGGRWNSGTGIWYADKVMAVVKEYEKQL